MSKIVACYKWVLDESDIRINSDLSVDFSKAKGKISDYDRNAIEAAVKLAEAVGAKPVGLTFGSSKARQSLKDALSRGLEEAFWVKAEEAENADGAVTARALAAGIKAMGDVALVICAEGASDTYARQTASRIGALLDLPVVTSVLRVTVEGNTVTAVRKLDDCLETVKFELPGVISVLPEAFQPTIPGLKAVMAAGKKPVTEYDCGSLGVNLVSARKVMEVKAYAQERRNIIIEGDNAAAKVAAVVSNLKKEGVL
ncbi:MAG: electron transfer flavoprotein beta subunit/FixA family protein [Syntrophomonadaceae bacterium]|nr:electron transfer flavoprotein beta subunit/FixA family protein [Syntrophomonadaceae bacterium]